jgi:hypothetical protein
MLMVKLRFDISPNSFDVIEVNDHAFLGTSICWTYVPIDDDFNLVGMTVKVPTLTIVVVELM